MAVAAQKVAAEVSQSQFPHRQGDGVTMSQTSRRSIRQAREFAVLPQSRGTEPLGARRAALDEERYGAISVAMSAPVRTRGDPHFRTAAGLPIWQLTQTYNLVTLKRPAVLAARGRYRGQCHYRIRRGRIRDPLIVIEGERALEIRL